jgi:hypothetical protein
MDIDSQVNQIVQNVVADVTNKIQAQAMDTISTKINQLVDSMDYNSIVSAQLNQILNNKINLLPIDTRNIEAALTDKVDAIAQNLYTSVHTQSLDIVTEAVNIYINRIDFQQLCQTALVNALANSEFTFPENSINSSAVDKSDFVLSGDNIVGGIMRNFGSTGIDDQATDCRLSVFDDMTVIENNLITQDLTVKGIAIIEGDLNVTGTVDPTSNFYLTLLADTTDDVRRNLDDSLFHTYSDKVFERIASEGLDLNKITLNGETVVNGRNLSNQITVSNLQQVGSLKELRVTGESLISQTLYTTNKRVGINTIEPGQALSIWDQEVEIGIGKIANNTAVIGTPRNQTLIIGSNGKNNIAVLPDGAIAVDKLNIGHSVIMSSLTPPMDNQPKGTIVFNANPNLGGPIGWVSLGDARWGNFGIID